MTVMTKTEQTAVDATEQALERALADATERHEAAVAQVEAVEASLQAQVEGLADVAVDRRVEAAERVGATRASLDALQSALTVLTARRHQALLELRQHQYDVAQAALRVVSDALRENNRRLNKNSGELRVLNSRGLARNDGFRPVPGLTGLTVDEYDVAVDTREKLTVTLNTERRRLQREQDAASRVRNRAATALKAAEEAAS